MTALPSGFAPVASTGSCPYAAAADAARGLYGIQFHPEVRGLLLLLLLPPLLLLLLLRRRRRRKG